MTTLRTMCATVTDDRYMEFHSGTLSKGSHKWYWAVLCRSKVIKLYGRLPGYGISANFLTYNKSFGSARAAESEYDKVVSEKVGKGYMSANDIPGEILAFAIQQVAAVTGDTSVESSKAVSSGAVDMLQLHKRVVEV